MCYGFLPAIDGLADAIAVVVDTHQWPVVLPVDGLEVDDAPQDGRFLKVIKPPLAVGCIDQSTLMRPINLSRTLFEDNLPFVRTINVF